MRFGSVCSGIEAASIAWEPLGWKAAWFSEIEPFPCAVLAHHYPGTPNLGDMTALPERILSGEIEAPEMFCGGTPCQAFSVAGLRKSLDDDRGNLSLVFCEIANAIDSVRTAQGEQPAIIFWENVPGVLITKDNAFGCFLAGLAGEDDPLVAPGGKWTNAGYVLGPKRAVAWRVTDAQYFGVAQRRRRVFVVASAREGFDPAAVLFEFDGLRRDTAPRREARQNAAADAGAGSEERSGVVGSLACNTGPNGHDAGNFACNQAVDAGHVLPVITMAHGQGGAKIGPGGGKLTDLNPTLDTRAKDGPIRNQLAGAVLQEVAKTICAGGHSNNPLDENLLPVYVVPCITGDVAHTLKAEGFDRGQTLTCNHEAPVACMDVVGTMKACKDSGGWSNSADHAAAGYMQVMPNMQVRRLTPRECERLQGFPDDYTLIPWRKKPAEDCPDGPRYKALGNSWAVPNVRWIGRRIDLAVKLSISKYSKGGIIK